VPARLLRVFLQTQEVNEKEQVIEENECGTGKKNPVGKYQLEEPIRQEDRGGYPGGGKPADTNQPADSFLQLIVKCQDKPFDGYFLPAGDSKRSIEL